MHELLPFLLGALAGAASVHALFPRPRLMWFVLACIAMGALASSINGELSSPLWALFVSFDALLVWLGAGSYAVVVRALRALPS